MNKLMENKLRKLVRTIIKEEDLDVTALVEDEGLRLVIFSHLSDLQEKYSGDKNTNNKINFVKFLLHKFMNSTKINAGKEWHEFMQTKYYRK